MVKTGGDLIHLPQIPPELQRLRENLQTLEDLLNPTPTKAYAVLLHSDKFANPKIAK